MPIDQEQLEAAVEAILARRPQATLAELAAAAATAAAAANPQPPAAAAAAAADINAITHTIPSVWPEDVDGFFSTFEAACQNKNITQDGTKYSKLLSVLTPDKDGRPPPGARDKSGRLPDIKEKALGGLL